MLSAKTTPQSNSAPSTVRFEHYKFIFEAILDEPEARSVLKAFCDQVLFNGESLTFLEQVEKSALLKNQDNKIQQCEVIIDRHIRIGSEQEINISAEVRNQILNSFEQFKNATYHQVTSPRMSYIFDDAVAQVICEIKDDMFPRFQRSEHLRNFVKECERTNPELLKRIAIIEADNKNKLYNIYPHGLSAVSDVISDLDIEAIEALAVDAPYRWQEIKNQTQAEAFVSTLRFALYNPKISSYLLEAYQASAASETESNTSSEDETSIDSPSRVTLGKPVYRISGSLPYPIQDVKQIIAESSILSDLGDVPREGEISTASLRGLKTYPSSIQLDTWALPWPVTSRDFVTSNSVIVQRQEGEIEKCYIIKKSVECKRAPVRKGTRRANVLSGWILEKVRDNVTKYTFVEWVDLMCNELTATYCKSVEKKKFLELHDNLVLALEKSTGKSIQLLQPVVLLGEALDNQ